MDNVKSFNFKEWQDWALSEINNSDFAEHIRKDIVMYVDTLGFVFHPSKNRDGFFEDFFLIRMGQFLQKINQPLYDDFNQAWGEIS